MAERKCKYKGDCEPSPECKQNDVIYLRTYDYNKIQNYIEAIRLIAEKVGTAESDCIEQLAHDVGNMLYEINKVDKNID